jgi:hypothetical protein
MFYRDLVGEYQTLGFPSRCNFSNISGSALDLSKKKFSAENSCNSNNDDFEEMVG